MLSWLELVGSYARLAWLSARIVLHRKLVFMTLAAVAYYAGQYAFAVLRPGEGFGVGEALYVLVEVPGVLAAVYLSMDLVPGERQRRTLETLYATSSTQRQVWLVRVAAVCAVLVMAILALSLTAYLCFAEFPWVAGGLNAAVPALLFASLTLYLSIAWRSANAAAMLSLASLVVILLAAASLEGTAWFPFIKYFAPPMGTDAALWAETALANRLVLIATAGLLLHLALQRLDRRERLLT